MPQHNQRSLDPQHRPVVDEPAWVHGHPHEPNPEPPSPDATFVVRPTTTAHHSTWQAADLQQLPYCEITDCYIVSTGHGASGPFTFGGVRLLDFLAQLGIEEWQQVDVISADGFGARLTNADLQGDPLARPSLLAYRRDGQPLTREEGLVRLIVPAETDDALKQVKWVAEIVIK